MDRQNRLRDSSAKKKTRVLIIAGGRSEEHDASIQSARGVFGPASKSSELQVSILIITREGRWLSESESQAALIAGDAPTGGELTLGEPPLAERCDIVWPIIHCRVGGDGALQGLLEMGDVPYVGCEVLAMALCLDKHVAKLVLSSHGIPVVRHIMFSDEAYAENPQAIMQQVKSLQAPWFVKPANLGGSVGVTKVKDGALLHDAIEEAMRYDRRIIVEEGVKDVRELEVGVLGNHNPTVSPVGEVLHHAEFYDYETKYTPGKDQFLIPADVPLSVSEKAQAIALQAYELLDCAGFVRVDFFLDPSTDQLYLNEVNGSPAFTSTSAFPRLMQASGYSLVELIEVTVNLGLERYSVKTKARRRSIQVRGVRLTTAS